MAFATFFESDSALYLWMSNQLVSIYPNWCKTWNIATEVTVVENSEKILVYWFDNLGMSKTKFFWHFIFEFLIESWHVFCEDYVKLT